MRTGLLVMLSCCTTDVRSTAGEGQHIDSVAPLAKQKWSQSTAWLIGPEPLTVVGEVDGPVALLLGDVRSASRFTDGRIAIADNSTKEIRFFDAAGGHLRSVGRFGEGPGEYRFLGAMARTPHDTLLLADGRLQRITVLTPEGDYVRSFQISGVPATERVRQISAVDDRYAVMLPYPGIGDIERPEGMSSHPVTVWSVDLASGVGTSIGEVDSEQIIVKKHGGMRSSSRIAPFATPGHVAAGAGFVVIGSSADDNIRIYTMSDHEVRHLARVRPTPAVQPGDATRYYSASDPKRDINLLFQRSGFEDVSPRRMPAFDDVLVDPDSNVWVRRYAPPWERDPSEWDVHNSRGEWLGTVALPRLRPLDSRKKDLLEVGLDYALLLLEDSMGVQRVGLYRVRKPAA
jgi:hypothetical protein